MRSENQSIKKSEGATNHINQSINQSHDMSLIDLIAQAQK